MFATRFCGLAAQRRWAHNIGFIGLGNMGGHMARNLLEKGKGSLVSKLYVYDVAQASVDSLVAVGAVAAKHPAELASQCDTIVTMLPSNPHVRAVYAQDGDKAILSSVRPQATLIDCSTVEPTVSREMAKLAEAKSAVFVDAPVSGGVLAARDAGLTFMVGGADDILPKVKEVLMLMGKTVHHCGPVGSGEAAKICNNLMLAISMLGVSEVMNLGECLGLEPKKLAAVLNSATGRCWSSDTYNPVPGVMDGVPSSRGYSGGFTTRLMTKDLGLAQSAATSSQASIPLGSMAHQFYRLLSETEFADKDFSSIYQFVKKRDEK